MVTSMTYAIVDAAGNVTNVIIWDGKPPWKPPADCVAIKAGPPVGIGWTYADGQFTPPVET
jgi:hypothetical protein